MVAFKKAGCVSYWNWRCLLGAGILGDGLGALGDSVLGQLPGKKEPHGNLDLPGGDGGLLFVVGQAAYTSISIIEM